MIQLIDGLPDNVIGLEAVGRVEADDYTSTVEPALAAALERHDKLRLLFVLGDEFDGYSGGAMWEDTKLGVAHWTSWQKIAVVTDVQWLAGGIKTFGWIIPGEVKVFSSADLDDAKAWVSA